MNCYQGDRNSVQRGVALCHMCSAGLCREHAVAAPREVTMVCPWAVSSHSQFRRASSSVISASKLLSSHAGWHEDL